MKKALLFFLLIFVLALVVFSFESPEKLNDDFQTRAILEHFDTKKVSRVEVEQLLSGVQLRKKVDGSWEVAALPSEAKKQLYQKEERTLEEILWKKADASRVKMALGHFSGLEVGTLASKNPDKQALYQVGAGGLKLKFFDGEGNVMLDIVLGKNGPDFASTYFRYANQNEVYLITRSLLGLFSLNPKDWFLES